tara:strand:+ start:307 stop:591 length:285 start_codon:yes stop_codon:yes gene_type:complete
MKRLLIPLVAALALPTVVNAGDATYLLLHKTGDDSLDQDSFVSIPVKDIEQCKRTGEKWLDMELGKANYGFRHRVYAKHEPHRNMKTYECLVVD